jgi:hypothetical protein
LDLPRQRAGPAIRPSYLSQLVQLVPGGDQPERDTDERKERRPIQPRVEQHAADNAQNNASHNRAAKAQSGAGCSQLASFLRRWHRFHAASRTIVPIAKIITISKSVSIGTLARRRIDCGILSDFCRPCEADRFSVSR